ncbi:lipoprotein [Geomonas silvestris]|uniref:Lipoprotein n=1 Tax=Geomonas silvestris TaxID=2740184 RepID=A0A6V8MLX9_9BACT|nr:DUF4810 domain-containing protein [Geomonas silvestris]GFO61018.1 lipoprotein [Geomonas silvestris]
MTRSLALALAALTLAGCATKPVYYYGDYTKTQLEYVREPNEQTMKQRFEALDDIIANSKDKSSSGRVPPGIYADYGYLLTVTGKNAEAVAKYKQERELYPESAVFVDYMINKTNSKTVK